MKIIVNRDIPQEALENLSQYGDLIPISSYDITYTAIVGHPDIFMCQIDDKLVVSPNLPSSIVRNIQEEQITFVEGESIVGSTYPETAHYNAVVSENYLIHKLGVTDSKILEYCSHKKFINVNQAYTRCNLLPLKNDCFITSDKGIFSILKKNNLDTLFVDPQQILLPNFNNGFFGGVCGVIDNKVFIIGNLSKINDGNNILEFLTNRSYEIIELYSGPLFDGGSMFFIND